MSVVEKGSVELEDGWRPRVCTEQAQGPKFRQLAPKSDTVVFVISALGRRPQEDAQQLAGQSVKSRGKLQVQTLKNKVEMQLTPNLTLTMTSHMNPDI